jgi:alpha,alpha-trehalose phosphorylase
MIISRNNRLEHEDLLVDESIFALQNGLIGIRGNFAEGYGTGENKETLINGFYNFYDYSYEENSIAFPQKGQRIVNVTDSQTIELYVNNKPLNLKNTTVIDLKRELDLETGLSKREILYQTEENRIRVIEERLVLYDFQEAFLIRLKITPLDNDCKLKIVSKLKLPKTMETQRSDSRIHKPKDKQFKLVNLQIKDGFSFIQTITTKSKMQLGTGMFHSQTLDYHDTPEGINGSCDIFMTCNETYEIEKYVIYTPSHIHSDVHESNIILSNQLISKDFEYYINNQRKHLKDFWQKTVINILGNDVVDLRVKYNLFQLYSSARIHPDLSIPAKGLTGEGYEGHYFWDTEIYMIPFFALTNPLIAKSLLLYRYFKKSEAKEMALKQGIDKGIKFPWRTINGLEASPYFLAGSAQYHINADIGYAFIKYYEFTGDLEFMFDYGFEILLETSRFLYASGNYFQGKFHINNITGPDEYTVLVNDNYYTNSMAKYQFEFIVQFYKSYKEQLKDKIKLLKTDDKEIDELNEAARLMTIIYDSNLQVYAQDSSFFNKKELNLEKLPKDSFPLLLHYHPIFIYRHQVLKQADVLLSMFLLDYPNIDVLEKNFDYYLKRTTHDSSLSKCIHAIVAFRLKKKVLASQYLEEIISMDFDNTNKNTDHGLHIANAGGIYLAILFGVFGLRIAKDHLIFRPILPNNIKGIETRIKYRECDITIQLEEKVLIKVSQPIKLGIYTDIIHIQNEYLCDYKDF